MKTLLIIIAVALGASPAFADDAFVAGNQAAVAGDTHAAIDKFEQSLAHGWSEAALFDLGNAYASAGDIGHAILAYERARLLAPSDAALAQNLAHVRADAGLAAVPSPSSLDRALAVLTPDDWTWLALAAGAIACAGVVALGWAWRRSIARATVITGTLIAIGCGLAAAHTEPSPNRAIVLARTAAHLAPIASADPVWTLPAGAAVTIEDRHGDFVYVRDHERAGWVPASTIETVLPEPGLQSPRA